MLIILYFLWNSLQFFWTSFRMWCFIMIFELLVPHCTSRHVKEPKSDVEVATFGKILGHFSPIVPPPAAGFASVTTDAGDPLWWDMERSKPLVLQVGGLTCCWQWHSVKTFCCECSTIVEQAKTQLKVAEPLEERSTTLCFFWYVHHILTCLSALSATFILILHMY
jgi:hypothetical protein